MLCLALPPRHKVQKLDFQSEFSMSKIIRIFLVAKGDASYPHDTNVHGVGNKLSMAVLNVIHYIRGHILELPFKILWGNYSNTTS